MFNFKNMLSSNTVHTPCSIPHASEAKEIQKVAIENAALNKKREIEEQTEILVNVLCKKINQEMRNTTNKYIRYVVPYETHREVTENMEQKLKNLGYIISRDYNGLFIEWL